MVIMGVKKFMNLCSSQFWLLHFYQSEAPNRSRAAGHLI